MRNSLFSAICVAAVAAITYATPSSAQTVALGSTSPTKFAREALAENPELTLRTDSNRNKVRITYTFANTGGVRVDDMRTADITFALQDGATFAAAPTALVLTEGTGNAAASNKISQRFVSGSEVGSSSVTYRVSTVMDLIQPNTIFEFTVPKLSNAASILRMPNANNMAPALRLKVTVAPSSADALEVNKFPQFPAENAAATVGVVTLATGHDAVILSAITPASGATSTAPVISLSDRTELSTPSTSGAVGTVRTITNFPGNASRNGIVLGRVSLAFEQYVRPPDAATGASIVPTASDQLVVTVRGDFEDGDVLIFSPSTAYSAARALTISGGVATQMVPLNVLTTTATPRTFYYFPASGSIGQKSFSFMYSVRWQAATLEAREIPAGSTRVQYAGLQTMAYAYGIPNPRNADQGNLRIRCQTELPCAVFFDCTDHGGARLGDGTLKEVTIPGRNLMMYTSNGSLPDVLDVSGWTGRLSCDIMSPSDVSVQLLVRSGSVGTLTNNTYISGLDPNP